MASQFKAKKFGCGRYIQEPDALQCLGREARFLKGTKALIIGGKTSIEHGGPRMEASLKEAGVDYAYYTLTTDCSYETLDQVAGSVVPAEKADIIIGTGGGKAMDMAKAVANKCGLPLINAPSSVATFNCWSAMSVMYSMDHKPIDRIWHEKEVDCVILDTKLISEAPVKLFASGMADCLAKYIETGFMCETYTVDNMAADMYTSKVMARTTNEIILHKGEKAYRDCIAHTPTQELEDCVTGIVATTAIAAAANYANHSALVASANNTGCPFAHGLYYAVRTLYTEECWEWLHGEIVGLGLRAEMAAYGRSEYERMNLCRFLNATGQPASLKDMGIDISDENLKKLTDCIMVVWGKHPDWHRDIIYNGLQLIKS